MFSIFDLVIGAVGIRLTRLIKKITNKPDIVFVTQNIGFGGNTNYQELLEIGVTSILDLRKEKSHSVSHEKISYLKIGIPNGGIPNENQIIQMKDWINKKTSNNEVIFIHCNLGRGRATLLTSLYLASKGMNFESIMKLITTRRFVYLNKKQLFCLKRYIQNYF